MVSEYDLPCTDCGHDLVRSQLALDGGTVAVAECQHCGTRHYPESALGHVGPDHRTVRSRKQS